MHCQLRPLSNFLLFSLLAISAGCFARSSADVLKDKIDSIRRTHGIAATAYLIVTPTSIEVLQFLGKINWENDIPFGNDHLVRIGSITKTFTALAATILAERQALQLDGKVTAVLTQPPYDNPWSSGNPVRIDQLIEHTAGLRDFSAKEFDFNEPVSLAAAFLVDPGSRRLAWPPGLHSSYSNSGAGIVSAIIEKVSGEDYVPFVGREIFTPLKMSSARFSFQPPEHHRLVAGYDSDGHTRIKYWHTLYPAFGGISITLPEMASFVQLFLNSGAYTSGRLVEAATIERMQSPSTTLAARSGLSYGYGLGIYQYQHDGVSFYGHGGDADGTLSFFAYSPSLRRGYFLVINAFNSPVLRRMRALIEEEIVGDGARKPDTEIHMEAAHLALLSGTYTQVTHRFARPQSDRTLEVILDNGRLYSAADSRRKAMLAESPWHFRRREQTVATIAFIPCGDRIYLQGDFGNYEKLLSNQPLPDCPPAQPQVVSTQRTPVPPIPQ